MKMHLVCTQKKHSKDGKSFVSQTFNYEVSKNSESKMIPLYLLNDILEWNKDGELRYSESLTERCPEFITRDHYFAKYNHLFPAAAKVEEEKMSEPVPVPVVDEPLEINAELSSSGGETNDKGSDADEKTAENSHPEPLAEPVAEPVAAPPAEPVAEPPAAPPAPDAPIQKNQRRNSTGYTQKGGL